MKLSLEEISELLGCFYQEYKLSQEWGGYINYGSIPTLRDPAWGDDAHVEIALYSLPPEGKKLPNEYTRNERTIKLDYHVDSKSVELQ